VLARLRTTFLCLLCLGSLASCAGTRHLRYVEAGEATSVPRYIALEEEQSIATVHFPRGLYSLDLEDDGGYYYRAPGSVIKHSFAGFDRYDGGIFVAKQSRRIRGYLVWAGGRTQIGNLSGAKYAFRD
jgi:hypothetical protein